MGKITTKKVQRVNTFWCGYNGDHFSSMSDIEFDYDPDDKKLCAVLDDVGDIFIDGDVDVEVDETEKPLNKVHYTNAEEILTDNIAYWINAHGYMPYDAVERYLESVAKHYGKRSKMYKAVESSVGDDFCSY